MSAWIVSPKGSSLNRRLRAIEESSHTSGNFSDRYSFLGPALADEQVDLAVVERLLADSQPNRAADEVGVGELLAGALVAVVEEDGAAALLEGAHGLVRDFSNLRAAGGERDHVHVVRRHRSRPHDPVLVVVLFNDRGHDASGPDAVAAAEQRLLPTVLVEERCAQGLGVEGAEVEDVADLDRGLEDERTATQPAAVTFARLAQVGEPWLVVPASLDAAQVPPVAVCAGDELPLAQRFVGDHLAGEPDRAERAAACAERVPDLDVRRRAGCAGQRVVELRLAEPIVAADERKHNG